MFTGSEDHAISFNSAGELTKRYRANNPDEIKGEYFSKKAINQLLNQTNCVGIRIYFGNDTSNNLNLVIVGVNSEEDDLVGATNLCMEFGIPCPDNCSTDNMLNS